MSTPSSSTRRSRFIRYLSCLQEFIELGMVAQRCLERANAPLDPTAQRMVDQGHDPDSIEDAYTIPMYTRVRMQHWLQQYVDHGISSTINISRPVTDREEVEEIASMLFQFLPGLRGVTVYPDGARGHQPIKRLSYSEALNRGAVVKDNEDRCVGGSCGV